MNEEQRKVIAVAAMGEMFGRTLSKAALKMFVAALGDVSADDVERAATQAVKGQEFMPTPAKIRELCGAATKGEDRAVLAWMAFERSVSAIGAYRSVDFDDKLINATIRSLGGWASVCARSGEDFDKWLRRDFLASYAILERSGASEEMIAPLPGLATSGTVRRIDGTVVDYSPVVEPVATGLPWAGEPVKRIGQSPVRRTESVAPRMELKKP